MMARINVPNPSQSNLSFLLGPVIGHGVKGLQLDSRLFAEESAVPWRVRSGLYRSKRCTVECEVGDGRVGDIRAAIDLLGWRGVA
jgi:hypothetical protein